MVELAESHGQTVGPGKEGVYERKRDPLHCVQPYTTSHKWVQEVP